MVFGFKCPVPLCDVYPDNGKEKSKHWTKVCWSKLIASIFLYCQCKLMTLNCEEMAETLGREFKFSADITKERKPPSFFSKLCWWNSLSHLLNIMICANYMDMQIWNSHSPSFQPLLMNEKYQDCQLYPKKNNFCG